MATYVYRCPDCDWSYESREYIIAENRPIHCDFPVVRDYRAEGVGIGAGVRVSRTGTTQDLAHLFLPTNDEFKGPGDPDGTKGMREWRETHQPKDGNAKPYWPGEVERRVM